MQRAKNAIAMHLQFAAVWLDQACEFLRVAIAGCAKVGSPVLLERINMLWFSLWGFWINPFGVSHIHII